MPDGPGTCLGPGGTGGVVGTGSGGAGGSTSKRCGGVAGLGCETNEFCEYGPESCLVSDAMGVCTPIPTACPSLYAPVCGCDGPRVCDCNCKTFANDCERQAAAGSKVADGECPPAPDGGVPVALVLTPLSASFTQSIGTTSSATVFTVQNTGPGASGSWAIGFTGASTSAYAMTSNTCVASMAAGQSCEVSVVFQAPTTSGNYLATLTITAGNASGNLTAPLVGRAVPSADAGGSDATAKVPCDHQCRTDSSGVTGWYLGSELVCVANCLGCQATCWHPDSKSAYCFADCPATGVGQGCLSDSTNFISDAVLCGS